MELHEAIRTRILALCAEENISPQTLLSRAGLPPEMLADEYTDFGIVAIGKLCRVLGISVRTFFSAPMFFSDDLSEDA